MKFWYYMQWELRAVTHNSQEPFCFHKVYLQKISEDWQNFYAKVIQLMLKAFEKYENQLSVGFVLSLQTVNLRLTLHTVLFYLACS